MPHATHLLPKVKLSKQTTRIKPLWMLCILIYGPPQAPRRSRCARCDTDTSARQYSEGELHASAPSSCAGRKHSGRAASSAKAGCVELSGLRAAAQVIRVRDERFHCAERRLRVSGLFYHRKPSRTRPFSSFRWVRFRLEIRIEHEWRGSVERPARAAGRRLDLSYALRSSLRILHRLWAFYRGVTL